MSTGERFLRGLPRLLGHLGLAVTVITVLVCMAALVIMGFQANQIRQGTMETVYPDEGKYLELQPYVDTLGTGLNAEAINTTGGDIKAPVAIFVCDALEKEYATVRWDVRKNAVSASYHLLPTNSLCRHTKQDN